MTLYLLGHRGEKQFVLLGAMVLGLETSQRSAYFGVSLFADQRESDRQSCQLPACHRVYKSNLYKDSEVNGEGFIA